jgi:pimeloyl-ACP methyl ester carboxylesterase
MPVPIKTYVFALSITWRVSMNKPYVQSVISWVVVLFVAACTSASTPQSQPTLITPQSESQIESVVETVPYIAQEVTFKNGDLRLAGTLTLPSTPGPHPALITITGSGPQNRDNAAPDLPNYQPYRELAERLAPHGVATLRYDDRGVGASTGDISTATPPELATDVEAALAYLLSRQDIDAEQIGLLGHSEGGMIAGMVAARNPHVDFVIPLASPAVNGYELQREALKRMAETSENPELTRYLVEQQIKIMELALAEEWDALEEQLYQTIWVSLQTLPEEQQESLGDLKTVARKQAEERMSSDYQDPRYLFLLRYDPAEDWAQVTAPVLALFAEFDDTVAASQNQPPLEEALSKAGNDDVTIKTVPGVNHLFLEATSASPAEWTNLPQNLAPEAADLITNWILERTEASSEKE